MSEAEKSGKRKLSRKLLLILLAVAAALAVGVAAGRGLFTAPDRSTALAALCDGCFLSGVLFAGVGGLSWMAGQGAYDIFGYGAKSLVEHFNFKKKSFESFYDYKQRKAAEQKPWLKECLLVGGVFLLLSGLFLAAFTLFPSWVE